MCKMRKSLGRRAKNFFVKNNLSIESSSQMLCIAFGVQVQKNSELMFNSVEKKKMKVLATTTTRGVLHYGLAMYIKNGF